MKLVAKYILVFCIIAVLIIFNLLLQNNSSNDDFIDMEYSEVVFLQDSKIPCYDEIAKLSFRQNSGFWVLENYFRATQTFNCDESITYTTHSEYKYLDNLVPLLKRWQGPVSLSVYAPGTDFSNAIKRILYLRECINTSLVKDFVNFHFFFDNAHMPDEIARNSNTLTIDCSEEIDLSNDHENSYRMENNLTYPINMGRMIARDRATTYFVLASDIELYPNPNLIPDFLDMIKNVGGIGVKRRVYVLPIFESEEYVQDLPQNKTELVSMIRNGSIINFHKFVCPQCHIIPKRIKWLKADSTKEMKVIHVAKRKGRFKMWEPIYIGTKYDPEYDIRLSWEGRRDKMTQAFILCLLDYEFNILNNGFLIHKPGIKRLAKTKDPAETKVRAKQSYLINKKIYPALIKLYGKKSHCQ